MSPTWQQPSAPVETPLVIHPLTPEVRGWVQETLWNAAYNRPRSLQSLLGFSEIGEVCDRRLAYGLGGFPKVNTPDPWRADVGTAVHEHLAETFLALDAGSGRFLVETSVMYRGVPGTCDLFDRKRGLVLDWKTTTSRSRKMRANGGPTRQEVIQVTGYARGMVAQGERVELVGLAVLPVDLNLADIRVHLYDYTPALVAELDERIDRLHSLEELPPAQARAVATTLCGWCPWHRPGSTDLGQACPGQHPTNER